MQENLTKREKQILLMRAEGLYQTEIAKQLYLSIQTVKVYTTNTYIKLNARNATQAMYLALKKGLIGF